MDDFINSVSEKLGISSENATSATGGILKMVKQAVPEGDFSNLLSKIPGAEKIVNQSENQSSSDAGGILGSVSGMASGILGGGGAGLDALSALSGAGLDGEKGKSFLTMLLDYVKDKVGEDMVNNIVGKIPALKAIV